MCERESETKRFVKFLGASIAMVAFVTLVYIAKDSQTAVYPIVTFKYEALDDYYLECRSLHGGTGDVIIYSNKTTKLLCADGHEAGEHAHPTQKGNELL